jgi:hypothetical protein
MLRVHKDPTPSRANSVRYGGRRLPLPHAMPVFSAESWMSPIAGLRDPEGGWG